MTTPTATVQARPLLGKVKLAGILHTVTGLHMGAAPEALEIGGLDLPVIRNPLTREPYATGSGQRKIRSLLERESDAQLNRPIKDIWIHACDTTEQAANCPICRLFGSSGGQKNPGSNFPARLLIRDARLTAYSRKELEDATDGLYAPYTELKMENALDRITAAAVPRKVERVPAGTDFFFEMIYNVEKVEDIRKDLETLCCGLELLEDDSLGGHGARGSGKVEFYITTLHPKTALAYRSGAAAPNTFVNLDEKEVDEGKIPKEKGERLAEFRKRIPEVEAWFRNGGKSSG